MATLAAFSILLHLGDHATIPPPDPEAPIERLWHRSRRLFMR